MNYGDLIKRAARITWRYKVLWILGILLALTSGGGGGNGFTYTFNGSETWPQSMNGLELPGPEFWAAAAGFVALCCCLMLILVVIATIVQYVARTGLYRAVDQIDATGVAPTWRQGLRLGWSNRALRMFLLDLVVGLAVFLAAMVLLVLGLAPLLLLLFDNEAATLLGIAATVGLEILVILVIVVAAIVVSVLQQFWRREIALADRTVDQAFAAGTRLVRRKAGDVTIFWLLMAVIGVLVAMVMIPIVLALALAGVAAGGGLGYALVALTDSWVWAVVFGLPIFLVIVAIPMAIVQGIYLVFESTAWTLAYRQVAASGEPTVVVPATPS